MVIGVAVGVGGMIVGVEVGGSGVNVKNNVFVGVDVFAGIGLVILEAGFWAVSVNCTALI